MLNTNCYQVNELIAEKHALEKNNISAPITVCNSPDPADKKTAKHNVLYCHIAVKNAESFLCTNNVENLACNCIFFYKVSLQYELWSNHVLCWMLTHRNLCPWIFKFFYSYHTVISTCISAWNILYMYIYVDKNFPVGHQCTWLERWCTLRRISK